MFRSADTSRTQTQPVLLLQSRYQRRMDAEPSVAFMVVGQLRGFLSPRLQANLARRTLGSFKNSEIFILLKLTPAERQRSAATLFAAWRLGAARIQLVGTRAIDGELYNENNRYIKSSDTYRLDEHAERASAANISSGEELPCPSLVRPVAHVMFHRFRAAWRDLADCYAMVRSHEDAARRGRRFDWVVKLRSDEELCAPLPPIQHWRARVVDQFQPLPHCEGPSADYRLCHATDDHVAIVPRAFADVFYSAHREVGDSCTSSDYSPFCHWTADRMVANGDVPAECLLGRWLFRNNVNVSLGGLLGVRDTCLWRGGMPEPTAGWEDHVVGHCTCAKDL